MTSKDKDSTGTTLGEETAEQAAQATAAKHAANTTAKTARAGNGALDKQLQQQGFCGKRATVTIAAAREDSEEDYVFVSVNAIGFQIPRGKPYDVPVEVIEALQNAVETRYGKDGVGRQLTRHTFSVTNY